MKIAIMQPYIFPYIGYFQLIRAVDKFVVYDDVAFIKQGWINRNNILLNGERHLFSIPVENLTSFKKINETRIAKNLYEKWVGKFARTLEMTYRKAPYFADIYAPVLEVLEAGKNADSIATLCREGIKMVTGYLGIDTTIIDSSAGYGNDDLNAYQRVLDICKKESAGVYINAIGGQELYSRDVFQQHGIELFFLQGNEIRYPQYKHEFVPHLSIIDLLMFNSRETVTQHIQNFNLV
ncbi:MAG TPA: WbqC family protein [Puia sp.]|nr:WbqC family protein [Puia sp.]